MLASSDLVAIGLTLKLAASTTALLIVIGTPVALWLATARSPVKALVSAVVTLPLVLPPVVLGFYLLVGLGPLGPIGRLMGRLGLPTLPFTFGGLVVASAVYSVPLVVQPLRDAFEGVGDRLLEVAATLGAGPWRRFFTVTFPLSAPGYMTAAILSFSHTVGEFGVVLMVGGNIPGKTRVLSVALFDHVEALEYGEAHALAAGMLLFSLTVLVALQSLRGRPRAY